MIKNIFFAFIVFVSNISVLLAKGPQVLDDGLPGSGEGDNIIEKVTSNIIAEMIKYVAVLAVIALMISGIMYMFSDGEEEKTKKAKSWIIWSLVAVVLSISSYYIITTITVIQIGLN